MFTMTTKKHTLVLLCVLFGALLLVPILSHAQEPEVESVPEQTESATTTPVVTSLENLYPVEALFAEEGDVPGGFVVGPGKSELTIKPGESQTIEVIVSNRTGESRQFNLTAEDATGSASGETTVVLLGSDRGPYSLKDYVKVPYKSFVLGHNQRARIPVTVSIPADAEPGGLYGSLLVDTVAIESVAGNTGGTVPQSAVIARIGTLFFITIPGAVEKDGNLVDFNTIPKKLFYQSAPINFGILFDNRSSIHLAPYGEIRITNMFGEEVGFQKLEPWFVLPKALRLREVGWNREFLFGKYTATVYVNRSYDDIVDEMSYTFWVLPWKPVLGIFAGLFLVFFIIRAFFRNFEFTRKK
jgi:hypothetical protein